MGLQFTKLYLESRYHCLDFSDLSQLDWSSRRPEAVSVTSLFPLLLCVIMFHSC